MADPRLRPALGAIPADPARRWPVARLARLCGTSRSAFAATVGTTPADDASARRMVVAAERGQLPRSHLIEIALDLGYESESVFSDAFRRRPGLAPNFWARGPGRTSSGAGATLPPQVGFGGLTGR